MRHVCLVGRSPLTRHLALQSSADEFWGVGVSYRDFPLSRTTRIYEIHPAWMLQQTQYDPHHWDWLQRQTQTRVIVTDPETPGELFPLADALALSGRVRRGHRANKFLTSSLDFMLAHAVLEGVDVLELAGFDMETNTEYGYQVPGAAFWLGVAVGRGITVLLPEVTPLLKAKLYAIEAEGQMIGRQKLETYRTFFKSDMERAKDLFNVQLGKLQVVRDAFAAEQSEPNRAAFIRAQEQADFLERELHVKSGAYQALEILIDECDLKEPEGGIVPLFGKMQMPVG